MNRIAGHVRSNLVGYIALFVALGGTSYAAITIPKNSVGAAQIRNRSITPAKFDPAAINGNVRAWAIIGATGNVIAGAGKPTVTAPSSDPGVYGIQWGVTLPKTCATVANIDQRSPGPTETTPIPGGTQNVVAGYVSQVHTQTYVRSAKPRRIAETGLITLNQLGQPTALAFDVAVIC